jgi:hypothetical protein
VLKLSKIVKSDRRKILHFFTKGIVWVNFQNSFDRLWSGNFALDNLHILAKKLEARFWEYQQ